MIELNHIINRGYIYVAINAKNRKHIQIPGIMSITDTTTTTMN